MTRPAVVVVCALLFAVGVVALALGRAADAGGSDGKRLVFVHVTGRGPTARAWYQGAPPSGVPVQDALDRLASEGCRFVALASGGVPGYVQQGTSAPPPTEGALDASYMILLER